MEEREHFLSYKVVIMKPKVGKEDCTKYSTKETPQQKWKDCNDMKYILWLKRSKARNQQKTNGSGSLPCPRGIYFRIARKSDKQHKYAGKASQHLVNTGSFIPLLEFLSSETHLSYGQKIYGDEKQNYTGSQMISMPF